MKLDPTKMTLSEKNLATAQKAYSAVVEDFMSSSETAQ